MLSTTSPHSIVNTLSEDLSCVELQNQQTCTLDNHNSTMTDVIFLLLLLLLMLHCILAKCKTSFYRRKRERILFNIICLKLYQLKRITWWCLSVLESVMEFALQIVLKYVMLEKILKNYHGFPEFSGKIPGDRETLSIVCHVGLHVDFSSTKSSLGL